jgi:hypothetical protein
MTITPDNTAACPNRFKVVQMIQTKIWKYISWACFNQGNAVQFFFNVSLSLTLGTIWSPRTDVSHCSSRVSHGCSSTSAAERRSLGSRRSKLRIKHLAREERQSGMIKWPLVILAKRLACSLSLNGYLWKKWMCHSLCPQYSTKYSSTLSVLV